MGGSMRRHHLLPVILLALTATAAADYVPVGGKPRRGTWFDDGDHIRFNPYNSTHDAMTFGVERIPKKRIKMDKIRPSETPEEEYCRRAFDIREGEVGAHLDLAAWCKGKKLKLQEAFEYERALEKDPRNEEARKGLGSKGLKDVLGRNGKANPELGELFTKYLATENPTTRRVLFERMERDHDLNLPGTYLERAYRSAQLPRGRTDDVSLTFRSDRIKGPEGVRYTMYVPSSYDPMVPTPLIIGLHGGGRGGADGKKVVGNGPSAMNFFMGLSERHGWLVACPTAIQAPWGAKPNGPFLEAMLEELQFLYNVNLNRVYLAGHSMGGFGSWHWGPQWAERWAAVGPAAGGGGPASGRLKDTQTFLYLFHGADDAVVGPGSDRAAAKALLKNGNDFVYTELNGVGHGWPGSVRSEMAMFFETKRLARGKGRRFRRDDTVRSSWMEKLHKRLLKEEAHYLGNPEPPKRTSKKVRPKEERKRLLAQLDLGGGGAEEAAKKIAATKDEDAVKPLTKRLLLAGRVADDVRAAAATALGGLGFAEGLPALEGTLRDENDKVFLACLSAIESIGKKSSGPALLRALTVQGNLFDKKKRGDAMGYPDYEPRCHALGRTVKAVVALSEPKSAARAIGDEVVARVFETKVNVRELARAGHFPGRVKNRLARIVLEALAATRHESAAAVIERVRAAFPKDEEMGRRCDVALELLKGEPADRDVETGED
jgi:poly(3-hydroxybutyrate) depolymerase